ncbi:MAG: hypothetical protein P4L40_01560 [Terracidiphilus sp.]|nr:hypothetical protein [Terracidiphilus sp.]
MLVLVPLRTCVCVCVCVWMYCRAEVAQFLSCCPKVCRDADPAVLACLRTQNSSALEVGRSPYTLLVHAHVMTSSLCVCVTLCVCDTVCVCV